MAARADWPARVEQQGLLWHSEDGDETWNERAAYLLSPAEVEKLCRTARELAGLYHQATEHIVENNLWSAVGLQNHEAELLASSWRRGEWSLQGRFDFLFDAQGSPKLLEYNAETALSLMETAVIQKHWRDDVMPQHDQCNQLEEALVLAWQQSGFAHVHCAWRPRHPEVEGTVRYMAGLMRRAGLRATMMAMHRMGWNARDGQFVDHDGTPITHCFKLYPWEWMLREPFADRVEASGCFFIEPPWRLLLGGKGILCVLSELFADHPAVVPCRPSPEHLGSAFVSKPLFGHEGHNVAIHRHGAIAESLSGEYGDEPKVYQAFVESPRQDGFLPQFGVWMVRDQPVAIGVRETRGSIISGKSPFVPHAVQASA
ncbi:MAG: glutathionylspermidine synthase family protein [Chthoniobacter sp.]|uniref:glutathionylspermidine synthase family protein n=1 Tax=Chthoniobacter sp. TaxID=2510640 RepID=UPI0032A3916F